MSSTSSIPDDIAVWGDELLEKGDPLGQIIARPDDAQLRAAYEHRYFKVSRPKCVWKHGVIDELKAQTNWGHDAMDELTLCPATRFLRKLELLLQPHQDFRTTDPTPILVERGLPRSLREFYFWPGESHADVSEIYPRIANVERMALGEPSRVGIMNLSRLSSLNVIRFGPDRFAELREAQLPALETLEIHASPWVDLEGFELPHAPKLRSLALGRPKALPGYAEREWQTLFHAPIAAQVERIQLTGPLGREREEALLAHVPQLTRYAEIAMVEPRSKLVADALDQALGDRLLWI